ncbi:hypothetical protein ABPG72_016685 [Tetrahymena utriculariae]
MVYLDLCLSVESENLESLFITQNCEWYFMIKCTQCHQDHKKDIYFSENDEVEMKGGKGVANFGMTCPECKREGYISIHKDSAKKMDLTNDKSQCVIATFDCRNIEITQWLPMVTVNVNAKESGSLFQEIDLSDLPWCDYDEKTQATVQIEVFQQEIKRNNKLK